MEVVKMLRRAFRSLVYRPFKSADELWRKRTRWGAINEFFGYQIFASDDKGYNPPFLSNPISGSAEQRKWARAQEETLGYEYPTPEAQVWANRAFEFVYAMVKDRIKKDDVILDVGCYAGYYLGNFHERGHRNLWGIDPMKFAIEYGREKRPYINFIEGYFGPPENDVTCDLLVFFGSIFRIPYGNRAFDAIDRCATKYVIMWVQEACDDFNRDPHFELGKRGFICIEKHCVTEYLVTDFGKYPVPEKEDHIPIGVEGGDGPMCELGSREEGTPTSRNFRSVFLFRRIEPRPPAPKHQRGRQ